MVDLRTVLSRLQNQTTAAIKSAEKLHNYLSLTQTNRAVNKRWKCACITGFKPQCINFHGVLLEFQSCKCSPSLLISMAPSLWANMSLNDLHAKYKGRYLVPHMETIWTQKDISSYVLYCSHTNVHCWSWSEWFTSFSDMMAFSLQCRGQALCSNVGSALNEEMQ